ncbi:RagB/SusD family nutrient uptake outer membrane protein, partial [Duncaniella sp.]|uniref:RagB/SusD family nutrient uptake outer membrane protein n=1 Tax=Duncaniella sp. TaxID=2518496 RepID=UPI0023CD6A1F
GVVGSKEDNYGKLASMASPLNTYILRLADVYLTHAEACLGNKSSLTGGRGLESFNAIRTRAGVPEFESIDFWTIVRERRMEFCMEYCNWFDMVTWYRWKPQEMLHYFNEIQPRNYEIQNNGVERIDRTDGSYKLNYWPVNYTVGGEKVWRLNADGTPNPDFNLENFRPHEIVLTEANIFMPYPEVDVLQNPYLSKAPEPYDFGDDK